MKYHLQGWFFSHVAGTNIIWYQYNFNISPMQMVWLEWDIYLLVYLFIYLFIYLFTLRLMLTNY